MCSYSKNDIVKEIKKQMANVINLTVILNYYLKRPKNLKTNNLISITKYHNKKGPKKELKEAQKSSQFHL
jgi:hypothetical protein